MSTFSDLAKNVETEFPEIFGDEINYTQDTTSVDIAGVVAADSRYEFIDTYNAPVVFESRDFHIEVDLFVGLPTVLPKAGDQIKETINEVEKTYEVCPIGDLSAFTYQDDRQQVFIIHTKLVDD